MIFANAFRISSQYSTTVLRASLAVDNYMGEESIIKCIISNDRENCNSTSVTLFRKEVI